MLLDQWAQRWGVPAQAVAELRMAFGALPEIDRGRSGASEADNLAQIRLAASRKGIKLFRNNVGAGKLENGSYMRWGLCNDSAQLNKKIKSSDLIGIRPILITPNLVGSTIGQFIAREVKRAGWKYRGTAEEEAQFKFLQFVSSRGGDARFTNEPGGDL